MAIFEELTGQGGQALHPKVAADSKRVSLILISWPLTSSPPCFPLCVRPPPLSVLFDNRTAVSALGCVQQNQSCELVDWASSRNCIRSRQLEYVLDRLTYKVLILSDFLLSGSGCEEHSLCSKIVFIYKSSGLFILWVLSMRERCNHLYFMTFFSN